MIKICWGGHVVNGVTFLCVIYMNMPACGKEVASTLHSQIKRAKGHWVI